MPFSTSIDNSILDHYFGKSTWLAPPDVYVGLSSTTPTKAGANVTEPSGGSYARIQIDTNMSAAGSSATANASELAFTTATADWVSAANLTHAVFYDAVTAGTFIGFKALTTAKPVLNGDTAKFPTGDIDFAIGGS